MEYQMPPKEIAQLVDIKPTPSLSISPNKKWMLILNRPNLPNINSLAEPELKLAGARINPNTHGQSRDYYMDNISFRAIGDDKLLKIKGLPTKRCFKNIIWSPDGTKVAFTNTTAKGISLWVTFTDTQKAERLTEPIINQTFGGNPVRWLPNSEGIVYKSVTKVQGNKPKSDLVPKGPVIHDNNGQQAMARTYQDLLKNAHDEALFTYYFTSQLCCTDLAGNTRNIGKAAIIKGFSVSPNGAYILVQYTHKPFSYLVPHQRFPLTVEVWDLQGKLIKVMANTPLLEHIPITYGSTQKGPRSFSWRADVGATLYWVEAQDDGDAGKEADIRDQLFYCEAPFLSTDIKKSISFKYRYGGLDWGNNEVAVAYSWWWKTRHSVTAFFKPDGGNDSKKIIFDQTWEDRYSNPGSFTYETNKAGKSVLQFSKNANALYLIGEGASPEGNRPFIDQFDIATHNTTRLWRSEAPYYCSPYKIMDEEKGIVLMTRQSQTERPNYFLYSILTNTFTALTKYPHPYPHLKGVKKEMLSYERPDGVKLTAKLYLPPNHKPDSTNRLPVLMWAYPQEYKNANYAGQVKESPYQFMFMWYGSPLYWLVRGYAILDDFSMPIVGEGDAEPNDTYREQLVSNAKAAIDKLVSMDIADPKRIAVGGHSYGAFMTANLLAHSRLFAAGIARSGAYNRTLTPFGFQSEDRTLWQAPKVYMDMSPFMHANDIKDPILLIHGNADPNSGTYPIQSERFYNALKGRGGIARLVMLPLEGHGYTARESIMHMLWETDRWLSLHVKENKL